MTKVILFHWADYLVFAIFLVASSSIGFYAAWKDRWSESNKDYLIAGRKMHWIPTSLSMQAAFLSAVSVLSTPVEIYYFGTMFSYMVVGCAIAFPVASHVFLAFFYKLNLISAYEYLEMRFSKSVRIVGALTFFLMVILYNSILLYTPAIALAQVTGLSIDISILLCGTICTIYTFSGGMKGTIWIDSMQVLIIFVGFFFLIIFGCLKVGGLTKMWEVSRNGGRIVFDDFRVDPTLRTTFWTQTVGTIFSSICLWASSQTMIQKFLSVSSLRDACKTGYFNSLSNAIFIVMASLVGLISYAIYEGCDPLMSGKVNKFDQIVPLLVMEVTGHLHGLPGLFIATIFSASLSSLSGALTAMSAVTMYDFLLPLYARVTCRQMNDRPKAIITKALVLFYGVIAIGSGYLAQYMGDSILQITVSIFGFVGGPLTSLVVMGVCFPFINSWGALSGLVVSLLLTSWMAIGSVVVKSPLPILNLTADRCPFQEANFTPRYLTTTQTNTTTVAPWLYRISHWHYAMTALVVAIVVAVPVSLVTGRSKDIDPKLTLNYLNCCKHQVDDENKNFTEEAKMEQLILKGER